MKKCPYCAEDIKDEAIVCRYCGRDMPPPSDDKVQVNTKRVQSVWKQGAKGSAVITILYALSVPFNSKGSAELMGDLTFGLIATFIGWWLICTFIVWLWRKIGLRGFLLFWGITIILGLLYISASLPNSWASLLFSSPTPTPTITPQPTRFRSPTPDWRAIFSMPPLVSGCIWVQEISESSLGDYICVQGFVSEIYGNNENGKLRILFRNSPDFYLTDNEYYYPKLSVGDCVYASGLLRVTNNGTLFLETANGLTICP